MGGFLLVKSVNQLIPFLILVDILLLDFQVEIDI
jgi:hypothetical protein